MAWSNKLYSLYSIIVTWICSMLNSSHVPRCVRRWQEHVSHLLPQELLCVFLSLLALPAHHMLVSMVAITFKW